LISGVLVALVAGGAYWLTRPAEVSAERPKGAPAAGSCWDVDAKSAAAPFPWPGKAVDCKAGHTAEVFYVGQVDRKLAAKAAAAKGDDAKVDHALMYAQARRACVSLASAFLEGDWHGGRVYVLANWIKPQRDGHFSCAVAEAGGPTGHDLVARTASLKRAMTTEPLTIACVARKGSDRAYVGCDQPHDGEYTGTYRITPPDAPFNGPKIKDAVTAGCADLGKSYVGGDRTDLHTGYVGPTNQSDWLGSDQTFACYSLTTGSEQLKGSVKGLGSGPLPR